MNLSAFSISSRFAIPVERITGRPERPASNSIGEKVRSPEATFTSGMCSSSIKNCNSSRSKPVDMKPMPRFLA